MTSESENADASSDASTDESLADDEHPASFPDGWTRKGAALRIAEAYVGYPWMSPELARGIVDLAADLETNPFDLANLLRGESQFSPRAQNVPGTQLAPGLYNFKNDVHQHTGLVQFSTATAAELGTTHAELFQMTPEAQLEVVRRYFEARRPVSTKAQLFMTVFHMPYKDKPVTTPFPANVVAANPTMKTPADYIAFIEKYARLTPNGTLRNAYARGTLARPREETDVVGEACDGPGCGFSPSFRATRSLLAALVRPKGRV